MSQIYNIMLAVCFMVLVWNVYRQRKWEKDKVQKEEALVYYLSELGSCYRKYKNVEEAVEEASERLERENRKHRKKEVHIELPYAGLTEKLCGLVAEIGDRKQDGTSLFLKNLSYIREELKEDILFCQQRTYRFSGLTKLCMAPFFCIPLITIWAKGVLETRAVYYEGPFSVITTTICFVITVISYEIVAWLEMPDLIHGFHYKLEKRILKIGWVSSQINKRIEKHYSRYLQQNERLKMVQGFGNVREFQVKKICLACIGLLFGSFVIFSFRVAKVQQIPKQLQFPATYTLLEEEQVEAVNETMHRQFQELCAGTLSMEEAWEEWEQQDREIGETAFLQVKHCYEQWERKEGYLGQAILLFLLIVLGYESPEVILRLREERVKEERFEEVRRMQTVILVLAQDSTVTIERMLDGMEQSARLFRKALEKAVDSFSYRRKESIERLQRETACAAMEQLCDTILSCEEMGLEEVCSGLEEERIYLLREQIQKATEHMMERAALARLLAYLPFLTVLVLKLVLPFVVEGLSQLQLYSSGMSNYF